MNDVRSARDGEPTGEPLDARSACHGASPGEPVARGTDRAGASRWLLLVVLALAACDLPDEPTGADTPPTQIEGAWADREGREALVDDAGDAEAGMLDLGRLWAEQTDGYLILAFETGATIGLQSREGLSLLLDTDADAATGLDTAGVGAELIWHFGRRTGTVTLDDTTRAVRPADLGLVTTPTVTSDRFEAALRRDAAPGGRPLFAADSVRAVLLGDGDRLPDTGAAAIALDEVDPAPTREVPLAPTDTSLLRVVSYNVLFDNLFADSLRGPYTRILHTLAPDLVGFQEIYDHSAEQTRRRVADLLDEPSAAWHAARVHDNVALSRWPITRIDSTDRNGFFLIDLPEAYGTDLLFGVAHTPCCDRDAERQAEIDALMAYVRDARRAWLPEGTPIILAGDFNLVGDARQITTLVTGDLADEATYGPDFAPDWDASPLADLRPPTTGVPFDFTWYSPGSSFGPGRLDALFYTDAVLEAVHRFTLFTPGLTDAQRAQTGLRADDTTLASDHLPLVVDFRVQP